MTPELYTSLLVVSIHLILCLLVIPTTVISGIIFAKTGNDISGGIFTLGALVSFVLFLSFFVDIATRIGVLIHHFTT